MCISCLVSYISSVSNYHIYSYSLHRFAYADVFNQPIQSWDVSSVTQMEKMFAIASAFNQNLCDWKDAPALLPSCTSTMCDQYMFIGSQGGPSIGFSFDATQCVSVVNKYDKFI